MQNVKHNKSAEGIVLQWNTHAMRFPAINRLALNIFVLMGIFIVSESTYGDFAYPDHRTFCGKQNRDHDEAPTPMFVDISLIHWNSVLYVCL